MNDQYFVAFKDTAESSPKIIAHSATSNRIEAESTARILAAKGTYATVVLKLQVVALFGRE